MDVIILDTEDFKPSLSVYIENIWLYQEIVTGKSEPKFRISEHDKYFEYSEHIC